MSTLTTFIALRVCERINALGRTCQGCATSFQSLTQQGRNQHSWFKALSRQGNYVCLNQSAASSFVKRFLHSSNTRQELQKGHTVLWRAVGHPKGITYTGFQQCSALHRLFIMLQQHNQQLSVLGWLPCGPLGCQMQFKIPLFRDVNSTHPGY